MPRRWAEVFALLLAWLLLATSPQPASAQAVDCSAPSSATGKDYHGQTLTSPNFARQDLSNANFRCAILINAAFIHAQLTGADFSGARFMTAGGLTAVNDFSFANLTRANFTGAQFFSRVYFSFATLTSANFSGTDISTSNAVFGDEPLIFDASASTRLSFASATMNCEFIAQWRSMDLTKANVKGCAGKLSGMNFAGASMAGVDMTNLQLDHTHWELAQLSGAIFTNAVLDGATMTSPNAPGTTPATDFSGAHFENASLRYVDFTNATLHGANFSNADLEAANFSSAALQDNAPAQPTPAKFDGAHLKNVNFTKATLNGVTFLYASVYGTHLGAPVNPCQLPTSATACPASSPRTGSTCSCATFSAANLTRTSFSHAFIYGVDFSSSTIVQATVFDNAILVSASFANALFSVDPSQGGKAPSLNGSWLQGTSLGSVDLDQVSLRGAFVDFGLQTQPLPNPASTSNALKVQLGSQYLAFRNWRGGTTACLRMRYDFATTLPAANGTMTCPDGPSNTGAGCGPLLPRDATSSSGPRRQTNPHWFGGVVASNQPQGWYETDSTYEAAPANPAAACGGQRDDPDWFRASPPS